MCPSTEAGRLVGRLMVPLCGCDGGILLTAQAPSHFLARLPAQSGWSLCRNGRGLGQSGQQAALFTEELHRDMMQLLSVNKSIINRSIITQTNQSDKSPNETGSLFKTAQSVSVAPEEEEDDTRACRQCRHVAT